MSSLPEKILNKKESLEPMSYQDSDSAERELIMFDQRKAFPEEIETIKKEVKLPCKIKPSPNW